MGFKVIIAGSRAFNNYPLLKNKCDVFTSKREEVEVVSGMARGADVLGEKWAQERGHAIKRFPAAWDTHGKAAGYIRNVEMANYADALIAFWDGKSKGTRHMINIAEDKGLLIRIVQA